MDYLRKYFCFIIIAIVYYLLPAFCIVDTGSGMFVLFLILPAFTFFTAVFFTLIKGFKWYYSFIVAALWLPNIIILNGSAAIYAVIFFVLSLVGQLVAFAMSKILLRR